MKDFPAVHVKPDADMMGFLVVHAHQDTAAMLRLGEQLRVASKQCHLHRTDDLNSISWVNRIIGKQHPELLPVNVDEQAPAVELMRSASARLPRQAN